LDDFVIVNQLSKDASTQTVAMAIYGAARTVPTPATNAIGTLMLVTSTVVITLAVMVQRRIARRTAAPAILGDVEPPQAAVSSADVVRSVHDDLRLDDRHAVGFLTERGVAGHRVRVRVDREVRRCPVPDDDRRAPLGEPGAELAVLREPLTEPVEAFGDGLVR